MSDLSFKEFKIGLDSQFPDSTSSVLSTKVPRSNNTGLKKNCMAWISSSSITTEQAGQKQFNELCGFKFHPEVLLYHYICPAFLSSAVSGDDP